MRLVIEMSSQEVAELINNLEVTEVVVNTNHTEMPAAKPKAKRKTKAKAKPEVAEQVQEDAAKLEKDAVDTAVKATAKIADKLDTNGENFSVSKSPWAS